MNANEKKKSNADLLCRMVDDVVRTSVDSTGSDSEEALLLIFFEQLLAVLKLLFERQDIPKRELLADQDMRMTVLTLGRFIERFKNADLLRFKLKYCNFVSACTHQALILDSANTQNDLILRNELLDCVIDWFDPEVRFVHLSDLAVY